MGPESTKQDLMGQPLSKQKAALLAAKVEECSARLRDAQAEIAKEVWGQEKIIKLTLACMVAGGHMLAVGLPGVAKTRLVSRVARVMGLDWKRVQFTPDLMPSDILGSEILHATETGEKVFEFVKGPVFTQFLMADEINRAGPRTQSALLEAMQEKQVTAAGKTYSLRRPFTVMATQNPLEQEGTYPLPEAQLDRFLMRLDFGYPDREAEKRVIIETTSTSEDLEDLCLRDSDGEDLTLLPDVSEKSKVNKILGLNDLIIMQTAARQLPISDSVADAILTIVRNARPEDSSSEFIRKNVAWGPGPRASQAFALAAKAHALMDGRLAPNVSDVLAVVQPVLEHRMALSFSARAEGVTFQNVIDKLVCNI